MRPGVRPLVFLLALTCLAAGRAPGLHSRSAEPIRYTLSFPELPQRTMQVDVEYPRVEGTLSLRMSRSSPGRYALHEFARNVYDLAIFDAAREPVPFTQTAPHVWQVTTSSDRVHVRYRVFGDRLDGTYLAIDDTHAHINMPAALMWAEGREQDAVLLRVQLPPDRVWDAATQLFATEDRLAFTAPNLSYLMDSPLEVSVHVRRSFLAELPPNPTTGSRPTIALALHHTGQDADAEWYVEGLRRIVREQAAMFGEYPAFEGGRYTFIADYLPWAVADAMEHRNSTVLTGPESLAGRRVRPLATAAHEFFHVWNVERIRPRSLEPFDLLDINPSGELWLAEGFTNYYEILTMARTGLWTLDEALAALGSPVSAVMTSPAARHRSAEEISHLASVEDGRTSRDRSNWSSSLTHYTHGAALALGFDLAIRGESGNARSLDDFMRAMWTRHGRVPPSRPGFVDAPYTADDVRARLAETTGDARFASGLLNRYVRGREVMDYPRLVALAGLRLRPASPGRASLGVAVHEFGGLVRVAAPPPPGSPAALAGLAQDDVVVSLGGRRIDSAGTFHQALAARRPGERLVLEYQRRSGGPNRATSAELTSEPGFELVTVESVGETVTPAQRAFRSAWFGSRAVPVRDSAVAARAPAAVARPMRWLSGDRLILSLPWQ